MPICFHQQTHISTTTAPICFHQQTQHMISADLLPSKHSTTSASICFHRQTQHNISADLLPYFTDCPRQAGLTATRCVPHRSTAERGLFTPALLCTDWRYRMCRFQCHRCMYCAESYFSWHHFAQICFHKILIKLPIELQSTGSHASNSIIE